MRTIDVIQHLTPVSWETGDSPHVRKNIVSLFSDMTPSALLLYMAMVENQFIDGKNNQYPFCRLTTAKLASITKMNVVSIMRLLALLIKNGIIKKIKLEFFTEEGLNFKSNGYILLPNIPNEHTSVLKNFEVSYERSTS